MMVRRFLRICHIAAMLLAAFAAAAEPAASVRMQLDNFMAGYTQNLAKKLGQGARIDYSISALDTHTNVQNCAGALTIKPKEQPTQTLNRVNLQIDCENAWSIYLPVDLDVYRPVAVAAKPLAPGAVITADAVELAPVKVDEILGTYALTLDDVVGMGVKRAIAQGRPVLMQQLEAPLLIRRGDAVIISAEASSLAVRMPGTALTDGRRGEQIRIKNQSSARIVDARVTGPGMVVVPM